MVSGNSSIQENDDIIIERGVSRGGLSEQEWTVRALECRNKTPEVYARYCALIEKGEEIPAPWLTDEEIDVWSAEMSLVYKVSELRDYYAGKGNPPLPEVAYAGMGEIPGWLLEDDADADEVYKTTAHLPYVGDGVLYGTQLDDGYAGPLPAGSMTPSYPQPGEGEGFAGTNDELGMTMNDWRYFMPSWLLGASKKESEEYRQYVIETQSANFPVKELSWWEKYAPSWLGGATKEETIVYYDREEKGFFKKTEIPNSTPTVTTPDSNTQAATRATPEVQNTQTGEILSQPEATNKESKGDIWAWLGRQWDAFVGLFSSKKKEPQQPQEEEYEEAVPMNYYMKNGKLDTTQTVVFHGFEHNPKNQKITPINTPSTTIVQEKMQMQAGHHQSSKATSPTPGQEETAQPRLADDLVFIQGVTVAEMRANGFKEQEIMRMYARVKERQETQLQTNPKENLAGKLAQAGEVITMNAGELGITNKQVALLQRLGKEG